MRAIILVMDSVGVGGAPDAATYGDEGADTIGHIAAWCERGEADSEFRAGPLAVPNLIALGLAEACTLAVGRSPKGLRRSSSLEGRSGCGCEVSRGKDTPSGHWELSGVPVTFDWGYFPRELPCFPRALVGELCARADVTGILGNCHASGTEIITRFGAEHTRSKRPICYTSADSVFQIAAHEEAFGLDRLYALCAIAREMVDPLNICRVIARPFVGSVEAGFKRTGNRRDYSVPPPGDTILDRATQAGRQVITIGKIHDIFAHRATGLVLKGDGNEALFDQTLHGLDRLEHGGLLFANFIDFDSIYGHRRDVSGYAFALEAFDRRLSGLLARLRPDDLLIVTADHGCDPTWQGSDHTRECVPILVLGGDSAEPIGVRRTFADVGASVAAHLELAPLLAGTAF